MKKVLLVIIDALASRVVRPAMLEGRLPHLKAIAEAGHVHWDSTSIFPSITPAATAALLTGGYPADTGIAGAYFYDTDGDRIHYYGDDFWPILNRGFASFFDDFLVQLNHHQLKIDTAFQTVERAGFEAASLNFLWFRGDVSHRVNVPWLLRLLPGVEGKRTVKGPSLLSLGDLVSDAISPDGPELKGAGGATARFGFTDAATAQQLLLLALRDPFPDFTIAYFPDNDFESHSVGPEKALATLTKVDQALGEFIEAQGGMETMLRSLAIVVTGDHAQSDLATDEKCGINLESLFAEFQVTPAGECWSDSDDLMICPNMRAAQFYLRERSRPHQGKIVDRLLADRRIDQVMWHDPDSDPRFPYRVQTARHGLLEFGPARQGEAMARDVYGTRWSWRGSLASVDARLNEQGQIEFGDYPNALERILSAFHDQVSGDLWVTSQPGFEFRIDQTSTHRGGSHGSLHRLDSHSPLFLAGFPDDPFAHRSPRSVDVAPLCLSLLGLQGLREIGASHVEAGGQE